ncbi:hypothetical protein HK098_002219 [Nowakowskiella sp. JEL0407]|nr:hypothetical protein HK098_002219 [Nowakowskiella sp. JEL0407]
MLSFFSERGSPRSRAVWLAIVDEDFDLKLEIEPLKINIPLRRADEILEDTFSFLSFLLDESASLPRSLQYRLLDVQDELSLKVYANEELWRNGRTYMRTTDSLADEVFGKPMAPLIIVKKKNVRSINGTPALRPVEVFMIAVGMSRPYSGPEMYFNDAGPVFPLKLMAVLDHSESNVSQASFASFANLLSSSSDESSGSIRNNLPPNGTRNQRRVFSPRSISLANLNPGILTAQVSSPAGNAFTGQAIESASAQSNVRSNEALDVQPEGRSNESLTVHSNDASIESIIQQTNVSSIEPSVPQDDSKRRQSESVDEAGIYSENWKCNEDHDGHDIFISYRVSADKEMAEILKFALEKYALVHLKRKLHVYLDQYCLVGGSDFQNGFLNGIMRSRVILLLCSENALERVERAHVQPDNLLLEWEYALKLRNEGKALVLPALVGTKSISEAGREALYEFSKFKTNIYERMPPKHSKHPIPNITVQEIMETIFSLQGVPRVFPGFTQENVIKILENLARVEKTQVISSESQPDVAKVTLLKREIEELRTALQPLEGIMELERERFRLLHEPNTREWMWERVENWMNSCLKPKHKRVLWLRGSAGLGKSVISALISDRLQSQNRLVTSFFCKYDDSRRNDPHVLVKTLAFGLALWNADFGRALLKSSKLTSNFSAVDERFRALILDPMISIGWITTGTPDAKEKASKLSETQKKDADPKNPITGTEVTDPLSRTAQTKKVAETKEVSDPKAVKNVKVADQKGKRKINNADETKEVDAPETPEDLKMYEMRAVIVVDALDECGVIDCRDETLNIFSQLCMQLPKWINVFVTGRPEKDITNSFETQSVPTEDIGADVTAENNEKDLRLYFENKLREKFSEVDLTDIVDLLVQKSKGAFIWASQALLRLKESSTITIGNVEELPDGLTGVYQYSLSKIYSGIEVDLRPRFISILSMIAAAFQPLTAADISQIANIPRSQVDDILTRLISVTTVASTGHIRFVHKSVSDYLLDSKLCEKHLFVDQQKQRMLMAPLCLRALNCMNVDSIAETESGFEYASVFWAEHLETVRRDGEVMVECSKELQKFLSSQLIIYHETLVRYCQIQDFCPTAEIVAKWINTVRGLSPKYQNYFEYDWEPHQLLNMLIESNFKLKADQNGKTLLYSFAESDDWECVHTLLDSKVEFDVHQSTTDGVTILHKAASADQFAVIKKLSTYDTKLNHVNKEGENPLFCAIAASNVECAELLMELGNDVNCVTINGESPLAKACLNGDLDLAQKLVIRGANVNLVTAGNQSILNQTLEAEEWECAEFLILSGAEILSAPMKTSPLHIVTSLGNVDFLNYLISKNADTNHLNELGESPVILAAKNDRWALMDGNLQSHAGYDYYSYERENMRSNFEDPENFFIYTLVDDFRFENILASGLDVNQVNNKNKSALMLSVADNIRLQRLIYAGANIDQVDEFGCEYSLFEELINLGANVNKISSHGNTPFHIACEVADNQFIEKLLDMGVDMQSPNKDGNTPLHLLCSRYYLEDAENLMERLMKCGIDLNMQNNEGQTPMYLAAVHNSWEVVNMLINAGADVNKLTNSNSSLLHFVRDPALFLKLIPLAKSLDVQDEEGYTPLLRAVSENSKIAEILLENGANVNLSNNDGENALFHSLEKYSTMDLLLRHGADATIINNDNESSLFAAVRHGNVLIAPMLQRLLSAGAKADLVANDGTTLISWAVNNNNFLAFNVLLENTDATFLNLRDNEGVSALYEAVSSKMFVWAERLINAGANVNITTKHDETPLHIAYDEKITQLLLANGAVIDAMNIDGDTPLIMAGKNENWNVMRTLINMGANVNLLNHKLESPLYFAAGSGMLDLVEILISSGARVNYTDSEGNIPSSSPLHAAADNGNAEILTFLLDNGAMVNSLNEDGVAAICLASENRHWRCVEILIENNSILNVLSSEGRTVLQNAIRCGMSEIVNKLLYRNADINKADVVGLPTLFYSIRWNGMGELTQLLLNKNPDRKKLVSCRENLMNHILAQSKYLFAVGVTNGDMDSHSSYGDNCPPYIVENPRDEHYGIARAEIDGRINFGKIHPAHKCAYFPNDGEERVLEYDVLCIPSSLNVEWRPASEYLQAKFQNVLFCETESAGGDTIAVASSIIDGIRVPGKAYMESKIGHFPYGCNDNERSVDEYDVLVSTEENSTGISKQDVRSALDLGINPNMPDKIGRTSIYLAVERCDADVLDCLIAGGAEVNISDGNGETPLHVAAARGNFDAVCVLLGKSANVNALNFAKESPLHHAVRGGNVSCVKKLIEKGSIVNAESISLKTALHEASEKGRDDIVELLCTNGASLDKQDINHLAPIHYAIASRKLACVSKLIQLESNCRLTNKEGETVMHLCVQNDNLEHIKSFIAKGVDVNSVDCKNQSALYVAAKLSKWDTVNFLLKLGANPNVRSYSGRICLHFAVIAGEEDAIRTLAEKSNLNTKDNFGRYPIDYAVAYERWEVVKLFLEKKSKFHPNTLHKAIDGSQSDVIEMLLKSKLKLNDLDFCQRSSFHYALQIAPSIAPSLIEFSKPNINSVSIDGKTVLHDLAELGEFELMKLAVENGANPNKGDRSQNRPLHFASKNSSSEHTKVVELLLQHKAEVNATNKDGNIPLHEAARDGGVEKVKLLLNAKSNVNKRNFENETPIFMAVSDEESFKLLFDAGADVNIENKYGATLLLSACSVGSLIVVKLLLSRNVSVNKSDVHKSTALIDAASNGYTEIVELLLDAGANVDAANELGYTALHLTSSDGNVECASLLLKHGASIDLQNHLTNETALTLAIDYGHIDIVKILLENNANPNLIGKNLRSPLLIAVENHHNEVIELLLSKSADVNLADIFGNFPLYRAAYHEYEDSIKILVAHGANTNLVHRYEGTTALGVAVKEDTINALIEGGADINVKNQDGNYLIVKLIVDHPLSCRTLITSGKIDWSLRTGNISVLDYLKMVLESDEGIGSKIVSFAEGNLSLEELQASFDEFSSENDYDNGDSEENESEGEENDDVNETGDDEEEGEGEGEESETEGDEEIEEGNENNEIENQSLETENAE